MKRRASATLLLIGAAFGAACGSSTQTNLTSPTDTRCQATVSNSASSFAASGGTGTLTIAVARECSWTASTSSGWIALTSSAEGLGDGSVTYRISENGDPTTRRGSITVAERQLVVSQEAAPCRFQVSAAGPGQVAPTGGDTSVDVRTHALCGWTASSDAAWISVSPESGRGDGTVRLIAAPNTGPERVATVTVAGERIGLRQPQVTQPAPAPAPTPPPAPAPPPPSDPVPVKRVELNGKVGSVSGSCPAIVFDVKKHTVYTTSGTDFKGGSCRDVRKGREVTVKGWEMSDNRVRADEVRIRGNDDDDDDDDGA